MMELSCILIMMVIAQTYTYVKICNTVHQEVNFTV